MKILKVEFENINSLAGAWSIDFTDPSYSERDHSLFVISGKTGVGKTSILDAITLALYGRTPRQKSISNGKEGNAVMTLDKGNCFARVTYSCKKGIFVSEWSQRRAHDKANGNLQLAQGKIYSIENPELPLFSGNGSLLSATNSEIIQLDYSQFCRSIMLAQGEFSEFLTCGEEERAKILEKLNGTEKYRLIGKKVGERVSFVRKEKELAQTRFETLKRSLPNAEDIANAKNLLIEFANQEKDYAKQKADLEVKINWRKSMDESSNKLRIAKNEKESSQKAKDDFAENEIHLSNAEKARECAPIYTQLYDRRQQKNNYENELKQFEKELPSLKEFLINAKEKRTITEKEKNDIEKFIAENTPLWNDIRTLDEKIKNAVNEKKSCEKRKNEEKKDSISIEELLKTTNEKLLKFKPKIEELNQFLVKNAKDTELKEVVSKSELLISNLRDINNKISEFEARKKASQQKKQTAETSLCEINHLKQKIFQEQQKLFENEVLVLADVIQKQLKKNVPCPVCGSIDHPACEKYEENTTNSSYRIKDSQATDVAAKIRELNNNMQIVDSKIKVCESDKNSAITAEKNAEENINAYILKKDEVKNQIINLWEPWAEFDLNTALTTLNELKEKSHTFEANKNLFDQLSNQLTLTEQNKNNLTEKFKECNERLEKELKLFELAEMKVNELSKTRKEKFGEKNVDIEINEINLKKEQTTSEFNKADSDFRKAENKFNELNTKIDSLKKSLEKIESDIQNSLIKFNEVIQAKGFIDETAFQAAFMPETQFNLLKEKKTSIDETLAIANGKYQVAVEAFEKLKAERSDEIPLQTLLEEKEKIEKEHNSLQEKIGATRTQVESYEKNKSTLETLEKDLEVKQAEHNRWQQMNEWFGKQDGSNFSTFVQGLTFKSLLKLANKHLQIIKDRFKLIPEGNLNFKVEDAELGVSRRISNLSGGEKFLVSLSLALGIADFASRNVRVESLFMDEGFGTLDENTLEDVMNCLRLQQREGKMLGIITHVESVIESISQKIELDSVPGQSGHSRITGPGVTNYIS